MLLCQNLAAFLKMMQLGSGKNQEELAQQLGISRAALSKLLLGAGNPRLATVERMAENLEIDPALLLCYPQNEDGQRPLPLLLTTLLTIAQLPSSKRRHLAELLQEMAQLWSTQRLSLDFPRHHPPFPRQSQIS